jgi:hypothetical protein
MELLAAPLPVPGPALTAAPDPVTLKDDDIPESSEESSADAPAEQKEAAGPARRSRRGRPAGGVRTHSWRTVGLFCTAAERDKPYLVIETRVRATKSSRDVLLTRMDARSEIAQLMTCPLYAFYAQISEQPDPHGGNGFHVPVFLEGPPEFTAEVLGFQSVAKNAGAPAAVDESDEAGAGSDDDAEPQASGAKETLARAILDRPLTKIAVEKITRQTALWTGERAVPMRHWPHDTAANRTPMGVRVVASLADDPVGIGRANDEVWRDVDTEVRRVRLAGVSPHQVRLTMKQAKVAWRLIAEAQHCENGYLKARGAVRVLDGLVLLGRGTADPYTLKRFMDAHKSAKSATLVRSVTIGQFIDALDADVPKGLYTPLHARPRAILSLLRTGDRISEPHGRAIPLSIAYTGLEATQLREIIDGPSPFAPAPMGALAAYPLLKRINADDVTANGGVLNAMELTLEQRAAYALDLVRLRIDEHAQRIMERYGSTAYVITPEADLPAAVGWLYGSPPLFASDDEAAPSAEAVAANLVATADKLRSFTSDKKIVRVWQYETGISERSCMQRIGRLAYAVPGTPPVKVSVYPLLPAIAGGQEAARALAHFLSQVPLANTVVITPYEPRRRGLAVCSAFGLLTGTAPEVAARHADIALVCSAFRPGTITTLRDRAVQERARVVVVDAAHLFSAQGLVEILEAFAGDKQTQHRNLVLIGAPDVLAISRGKNPHGGVGVAPDPPGAAFRDLVQTFLPLVTAQAAPAELFPPLGETALMHDLRKPRRGCLAELLLAIGTWRTHRGTPIVSFWRERPSVARAQIDNGARYHSLIVAGDTFHTDGVHTAAMHEHFVSDSEGSADRASAGSASGHAGLDLEVVYELTWDDALRLPDAEFLTILSHGYELALYPDPGHVPEWKRAPVPCPAPGTALEAVVKLFMEHYSKEKRLATVRHTIWELFGKAPYIEAKLKKGKQ